MPKHVFLLVTLILLTSCSLLPSDRPNDDQSLLEQADFAYEHKDWDSARRAYEALLDDFPNASYAHFRLGNIAYNQGRLEQAAESYTRAAAAYPEDPRYSYNLAIVRLEQARRLAQFGSTSFPNLDRESELFNTLAAELNQLLESQ